MPIKTVKKGSSSLSTSVIKQKKKKKLLMKNSNPLSIKIKPFSKPPALPTNFYQSSLEILWKSLDCILEKRPLRMNNSDVSGKSGENIESTANRIESIPNTSSSTGSPKTSAAHPAFQSLDQIRNLTVSISREELFGKVQDLCTHSYGPSLYLELINVLDKCALSCVSRLATRDSKCKNGICYQTPQCYSVQNQVGEKMIYFTTISEDDVKIRKIVLENIWTMWSDYVQFLNCVRSIFLSLDRMFIYHLPSRQNGSKTLQGNVRLRGTSSTVIQTEVASNIITGMNTSTWTLWDVGMYFLWKHCSLQHWDDDDFRTSSIPMHNEIKTNGHQKKYSVLEALKCRTISCLLDDLKSTSKILDERYHISEIKASGDEVLHKPLVRDCVSIFRNLGYAARDSINTTDTSTSQPSMNALGGFTCQLINEMTKFFSSESLQWIQSASISCDPTKTSYDARALLQHINARLKQVYSMTQYYLLSSSLPFSFTCASHDSSLSIIHGISRQNRVLTSLVEKHLLSPHFTSEYIFHPSNLYPILDQSSKDSNLKDVKLLYQLSKRVLPHKNTYQEQFQHPSLPPSASVERTGTQCLLSAFAAYGRERGKSILQSSSSCGTKLSQPNNKEMEAKIIPNLLRFKCHLESLFLDEFSSDDSFGQAVRNILEDVVNYGGIGEESNTSQTSSVAFRKSRNNNSADGGKRVAELLAKHMDMRFKNAKSSLSNSASLSIAVKNRLVGGTPPPDTDIESYQASVIDLFRHIQSKDIFEAFYRRDLAKRLLLNKSTSIDAERLFVSKLKVECGGAYTSKMVGMFKDMDLSKDVMGSYKVYLDGNVSGSSTAKITNLDVDVQVLTTGYWPVYPKYNGLLLPSSLEKEKHRFEEYYNAKYQGRRIIWQNALGNCTVKARFPKVSGTRDLVVNLCQALVLLCFNEEYESKEGFTLSDIMKKTGLDDRDEIERILQSLSLGREGTRVLIKIDHDKDDANRMLIVKKHPKKVRRTVSDDDRFIFNSSFKSNQHRIRITNIQMKETTEDRSKINEAVARDRLCLIDAVIVRIMKARKRLEHKVLLREVMIQVKFPASGTDIKKRIESLIEREYLQRSEDDRSIYNYLV